LFYRASKGGIANDNLEGNHAHLSFDINLALMDNILSERLGKNSKPLRG